MLEMIRMSLDRQAAGPQNLWKMPAQIAIGEIDNQAARSYRTACSISDAASS